MIRHSSVQRLQSLLQTNNTLRQALETGIQKAAQPGIETLENFLDFSHTLLTYIPTKERLDPSESVFYYIISQAPDNMLKTDSIFNEWLCEFTAEIGKLMDSTESAAYLQEFIDDPSFNIQDYYEGPSGWLTYNQFLARMVKSGKRPIASLCDDNVIVSATDSVYLGKWPIHEANVITKGTAYSVIALLDGSPYQDKFREGVFTHSYLSLNDYHHFHTPVSGIIREVRKIPGRTLMDVVKNEKGELEGIDDIGFQFTQTRGYIVIESPVGYVAVVSVGMGHVSSVTLTVDEEAYLQKGSEFGYFSFGGSDIIMLFEPDKVAFTASDNTHYKQGEGIAMTII